MGTQEATATIVLPTSEPAPPELLPPDPPKPMQRSIVLRVVERATLKDEKGNPVADKGRRAFYHRGDAPSSSVVTFDNTDPTKVTTISMLSGTMTIGRHIDCLVRPSSEFVSPRHCQVAVVSQGVFRIRDLGGPNGTVPGKDPQALAGKDKPVEFRLKAGECFCVGPFVFQVSHE